MGQVDVGKRLFRSLGGDGNSSVHHRSNSKRPRPREENGSGDATVPLHPMLQAAAETPSSKLPRVRPLQTENFAARTFHEKAARAGVKVLVLPTAMERHQSNKSNVQRDGLLFWTVEVCLHAGSDETTPRRPTRQTVVHNIPETTVVWEAIQTAQLLTDDPKPRSELYSVMLKKLPCPSNQPLYVEISTTSVTTIADALRDMTVVEFPTLFVVPRSGSRLMADFPRAIQEVAKEE